MTYGEWLQIWLEEKADQIKAASYQTYMYAIRGHLVPRLGMYEITMIDSLVIENAVRAWEEENLSPKTIRDYVVLIKTTLADFNRSINSAATSQIKVKLPNLNPAEVQIFTHDEQSRLIRGVFAHVEPRSVGIMLGLCAGLRIGEVCGLQWKNVDLRKRIITVTKTAQRVFDRDEKKSKVSVGSPKTSNSNRTIPIQSTLLMLLKVIESKDPESFVITGTRKCMEPKNFREFYYSFLEKYNIERLKFHCLRHTFGTQAIRCGVDAKVLQKLIGHSSVEITLALYVHPQLQDKEAAIRQMDEKHWLTL